MARITGDDAHARRLRNMRAANMGAAITQALFVEGQALQVDAQLSISAGAISGKNHTPSPPGEPPNNDTGVLAGNIETNVVGPLKVEVSSNAPYAAAQEFGSESANLPERPYMRPAAARAKERAPRNIAAAVDREIRRGAG